jgi:hypothetical protein
VPRPVTITADLIMQMHHNPATYGIEPERLYTKKEVAAYLSASINTVSKWQLNTHPSRLLSPSPRSTRARQVFQVTFSDDTSGCGSGFRAGCLSPCNDKPTLYRSGPDCDSCNTGIYHEYLGDSSVIICFTDNTCYSPTMKDHSKSPRHFSVIQGRG